MTKQETTFDRTFFLPDHVPQRVFLALTDGAQLEQWFAERVRVDPHEGGDYAFWGRFTPWVPDEGDANQRITGIDAGRLLEFTWTWRGCEGTVMLTLERERKGTKLRIHHRAMGLMLKHPEETASIIADFWRLAAGNLGQYLRTGKPAVRPDFAEKSGDVKLSVVIESSVGRVYGALTNPKMMDRWISEHARVEPRADGKYDYGWEVLAGGKPVPCGPTKIVEIIPERLLITDWFHEDEPETRVRWELEPLDGTKRTRVTLTHTRPEEPETTHDGYNLGWGSFLVLLLDFGEERGIG